MWFTESTKRQKGKVCSFFVVMKFLPPWEMCRQVIPDIFHVIFSLPFFRQELHYCHIFMNFDWMENSSNILRHRDKVFNNLLGKREITHSAYNGSQKKHLKLFFVQGGVGSICWNWRRPGRIYDKFGDSKRCIFLYMYLFLYFVFDGGKFENVDNLFIPAFKSTELETSTQVWNGETLKDTFTHQTKQILECLSIHIYPRPLFDYIILI